MKPTPGHYIAAVVNAFTCWYMLQGSQRKRLKLARLTKQTNIKQSAMTELQFRKEQKRIMKVLIKITEQELFRKLDKALASGAIPEEWKKGKNDNRTVKSVIDSFCLDRPFKHHLPENKKDAANLHLFI
jgi:hypothetical protein